jgi:hypothetical protein
MRRSTDWTLSAPESKISLDLCLVREDKEKNMSSLFARKRNLNPEMLTLPAFCVPAELSAKLEAKREAQLEWMRSKGVDYILGTQAQRNTPAPRLTAVPAPRTEVAQSPRLTPYPETRVA